MYMLQPQPGMTQERKGEPRLATDTGQASAERASEGGEIWPAVVCQFSALHVAEEQLDGVELRRVGGQPFRGQPGPLLGQVAAPPPTAVRPQATPEQNHALAAEVAREGAQEGEEGRVDVGARSGVEVDPGPAAIPAKRRAAATERRFQVAPGWVRTGGSPRGAQVVRRTTGCWERPLSSSKTSHARCRRAFFYLGPPSRRSEERRVGK